jgi:transcription antitermination factor NusG
MSYWCCAQLEHSRVHLALHCLRLAGYDTYAPRLRTYRISHGRRIEGRPLLFPSYVFVAIVAQWYAARWAPGVVRLLMTGDTMPARVPDAVIAEIKARERNGVVALPALRPGDRVTVTRGPLRGLEGLYAGQAPHERVAVLLALLGGQQRVTLPRDDVEALVR